MYTHLLRCPRCKVTNIVTTTYEVLPPETSQAVPCKAYRPGDGKHHGPTFRWAESDAVRKRLIASGQYEADDITVGTLDPNAKTRFVEEASGAPADIAKRLLPHASLVTLFSQGRRSEHFARMDAIFATTSDGQCEGHCIDWIRRVLQHSVERDPRDGSLVDRVSYDLDPEKHADEQEAAARQLRQHKQAAVLAVVIERAVPAMFQANFDRIAEAVGGVKTETGWSLPPAIADKLNAAGKYSGGTWEQLAERLDLKLPHSKRTFSGVRVVRALGRTQYAIVTADGENGPPPVAAVDRGIATFAHKLFIDPEFAPVAATPGGSRSGTAVLMSFELLKGTGTAGGSIAGHAIAGYCNSRGVCFLFDPNVGIFRCENRDAFTRALVMLVTGCWRQNLGWVPSGEIAYTLFRART